MLRHPFPTQRMREGRAKHYQNTLEKWWEYCLQMQLNPAFEWVWCGFFMCVRDHLHTDLCISAPISCINHTRRISAHNAATLKHQWRTQCIYIIMTHVMTTNILFFLNMLVADINDHIQSAVWAKLQRDFKVCNMHMGSLAFVLVQVRWPIDYPRKSKCCEINSVCIGWGRWYNLSILPLIELEADGTSLSQADLLSRVSLV